MNTMPFAKPPPAEPIPLDDWLGDTDRAEVGREAFFRGRDKEYQVFRNAVVRLKNGRIGGGTMVFQGAPGVGKTALMQECMEAVRLHSTQDDPWVAVLIKPENLNSSVEVAGLIVKAVNAESERLSDQSPHAGARKLSEMMKMGRKMYESLSERGGGIGGISIGGKPGSDRESRAYSQRVFENADDLLSNFHIVVFIDEAQNTPVEDATRGVVDCLHSPPGSIPLVSAFFGLSDTEDVLRKCGLSRFADERLVTLEPLPYPCARDVMQSIFDAYQFAGSSRRKWIDALAELSQGWPQHINRVSIAAGRTILDHGGSVNDELLNLAVKRGIEAKQRYYVQRLKACSVFPPVLFRRVAMALQDRSSGISRDELFDLATPALDKRNLIFDDFLNTALHAGVLMQTAELPGHYQIPIPSFGDYLRGLPVEPPP